MITVKKSWFFSLTFIALGMLLAIILHSVSLSGLPLKPASSLLLASSSTVAISSPDTELNYERYTLPQAVVHVVRIPHRSRFVVTPSIASDLSPLAQIAQEHGAVAGVNGGFFDPVNAETTSYVVLRGEVVADPTANERLVSNPEMLPYLEQILDRTEFRQYRCGSTIRYDITTHKTRTPAGCELQASLGAGPALLPEPTLAEEGFSMIVNGELVRDTIGGNQPNARSAVGITLAGDVILAMASQLPDAPPGSGLSLPALAEFMRGLGADKAMNLDGGSSSSLYFQGQLHHGKVGADGNWVERPIKSALLVED